MNTGFEVVPVGFVTAARDVIKEIDHYKKLMNVCKEKDEIWIGHALVYALEEHLAKKADKMQTMLAQMKKER